MKLSITIDEQFGDCDSAFEFVAKLKTVMSLPFDVLKMFAAAGVASAATNPAAPAMTAERTAHEVPKPRGPIQESSAAASIPASAGADLSTSVRRAAEPVNPSAQTSDTVTDGEGLNPSCAGGAVETSTPIVPPAGTTPRARRGRPPRAEAVAVAADAPTPPAAADVAAAVSAGKGEADDSEKFMTVIREHLALHGSTHYLSILSACKDADGKYCKTALQVPVEKRATFLQKLSEAVAVKSVAA